MFLEALLGKVALGLAADTVKRAGLAAWSSLRPKYAPNLQALTGEVLAEAARRRREHTTNDSERRIWE